MSRQINRSSDDLQQLLGELASKNRRALAHLLSLLARGESVGETQAALESAAFKERSSKAWVVAFTGAAGVGKSTLIGRLIEILRSHQITVAVLACDPQSPLTGGALLGDRIRMPTRPDDLGVFIRSLAVESGRPAIADNLPLMIRLLEQYGFEVVLLETVGAGQGDTAVRNVADIVALLVQPAAGDELQWQKAGVLEIADIVVVNKGDLPGAEAVEGQLRESLNLPGCRTVPVVRVSSSKNEGIAELWNLLKGLEGISKPS